MVGSATGGIVHPPLALPSREGNLLVSGQLHFLEDRFNNAIGVFEDIVIPEADDTVAVSFDHSGSRDVSRVLRMLSTVAFNCQSQRATREVDNVISNLMLTSELETKLLGSKSRPQAALGISHLVAQFARYASQLLCSQSRTPIPSPSLKGRVYC